VRSGRPRTWCPFSFPIRDGARGSWPRRGHDGANQSNAAAASYARAKEPRLNLAPGIDTHACWGARWHGASGLRGDARECERDRLGAASRTRVATHGRQRRHGKARPRKRRTLTKAATPATYCPSLARRPASPAAARGNDALLLDSKAGASTWGGKRLSSPRWPRAEVQASV
jgi:hypothetical protein